MPALTILLLRHAEKPGESWPGSGLNPDGAEDKKSLVIRGWQRAGSWCALFGNDWGNPAYPRPDVIYAADPNATSGDEPSQRPYETITPLAARLKLQPVSTYALGQEAQLVSELLGQRGIVLLCWEHKAIARAILPAIAAGQNFPGLPDKWDGTRFDIVLRFDRSDPSAPLTFRQLFPCLLSGDSDIPMK
jgi:hypothetical protein